MALELIVNIVLIVAAVYTYWYVGATMPKSDPGDLGAEQWPQFLLTLLIIAICVNLFNYFRKNKKAEVARALADFFPSILRLFRSKLFIGMALLIALAVLYERLGFFVTCLLFMVSYGILLGARKPVTLIVSAFIITVILYIGFSVFLGVMLPRGYVPFLRNFAFFLESLFGR
jgi:hypothetical protein